MERKNFIIGFEGGKFVAFYYRDKGIISSHHSISNDYIEDLLEKCRDFGLLNFAGLTREAVDEVLYWQTRSKPMNEVVERLWAGESSASRRIGFRAPERNDSPVS